MRRGYFAHEVRPLLPHITGNAPPVQSDDPSLSECIRTVLVEMRGGDAFSAWSHLVAMIMFVAYGGIRVIVFDTHTLPGRLTTASVFVYAFTFAVSTLYHITGMNRWMSKTLLEIDQAVVLISFAMSIATDVAVGCYATPSPNVRTWVDIVLAPLLAIVFFAVIHPTTDARQTWVSSGATTKGTNRRYHSDFHFLPARRGTAVCILLGWVPTAHLLLVNNASRPGMLLVSAYVSGVVLVLAAQLNDTFDFTDRWLPDVATLYRRWCTPDAHGIWHVVSALATVFLVASREYALESQRHLT